MRDLPKQARLVIAVLVLLGLACGPCNLTSPALPTPPHRVAVSTQAAGQLDARIQETLRAQPGQQFMVRVTDAEVTSLLAFSLAEIDPAPVTNLVVWFTPGKIHATARIVNVLPLDADLYLVASPRIQDGKLAIDIEQLSAGEVPIGTSVRDAISRTVEETIDELQLGVRVYEVQILEGEAIVKGVRE